MIPVKVGDITYKSIAEAWRELKSPVPQITVRWRLKNGWAPEDAFRIPAIAGPERRFGHKKT